MKRRQFMSSTLFAGLGSVSLNVIGSENLIVSDHSKWVDYNSLDLNKLHEFYRAEIFNRFIPHMDKYVIDHKLGGFMTSIDITNGKQVNSNKTAWFEGRGMWTYSFLYNNFEKNPNYLEIATKSKDFILKHLPREDQFFTSSYSNDGKPLSGPGDIYSSLFVAEGLFEFSKATNDKQYF
jgi:N-acylglucosamine 2-epimerase